jgi:hypothetical protein
MMRSIVIAMLAGMLLLAAGCGEKEKPYGQEAIVFLPGTISQTWAVAPALNLSGQKQVDPLLQADLLYGQLQQVKGLTVVPVNRVIEVYAALHIARVESEEQASLVCQSLGCDALVVPTVTLFDAYTPPKMGTALQWFPRGSGRARTDIDPRELARQAAPKANESLPAEGRFVQVAEVYDAANGTVRQKVLDYAAGRNDPQGPLGEKEYFVSMDRYGGFVYHDMIVKLLERIERRSSGERRSP